MDSAMTNARPAPVSDLVREAWRGHLRFGTGHTLFLTVATLDILLTAWVLSIGGREVNPVAAAVIATWGMGGIISFKFALTMFVITITEYVAMTHEHVARRLVFAAVVISGIPPLYSAGLLTAAHLLYGMPVLPTA